MFKQFFPKIHENYVSFTTIAAGRSAPPTTKTEKDPDFVWAAEIMKSHGCEVSSFRDLFIGCQPTNAGNAPGKSNILILLECLSSRPVTLWSHLPVRERLEKVVFACQQFGLLNEDDSTRDDASGISIDLLVGAGGNGMECGQVLKQRKLFLSKLRRLFCEAPKQVTILDEKKEEARKHEVTIQQQSSSRWVKIREPHKSTASSSICRKNQTSILSSSSSSNHHHRQSSNNVEVWLRKQCPKQYPTANFSSYENVENFSPCMASSTSSPGSRHVRFAAPPTLPLSPPPDSGNPSIDGDDESIDNDLDKGTKLAGGKPTTQFENQIILKALVEQTSAIQHLSTKFDHLEHTVTLCESRFWTRLKRFSKLRNRLGADLTWSTFMSTQCFEEVQQDLTPNAFFNKDHSSEIL